MAIKSVKQYLDRGGHVCKDCWDTKLWGEMGKCKKHTRVHTIRHMGFWRWLWVAMKDPVWTIQRHFLRKKAQRQADEAVKRFVRGETSMVETVGMVSMVKRK